MAKKVAKNQQVNIKNKRAAFEFELIDTFTAGIVLTGTEIKSIRAGKASLVDTYCYFINGELWVKNMYVAPYLAGSYNNHLERRERKLLLNKKELRNLQNDTKAPGFTIVPVLLYINENGLAKLEKEDRREIDRAKKVRLWHYKKPSRSAYWCWMVRWAR